MPTLFSPRDVSVNELAAGLVDDFDAWWPTGRRSGSVEDDVVYVTHVGDPVSFSREVGEPTPSHTDGTVVHLEPRWESVSRDLVAKLAAWLGERYGFRERPEVALPFPPVSAPLQSPAEPASGH